MKKLTERKIGQGDEAGQEMDIPEQSGYIRPVKG